MRFYIIRHGETNKNKVKIYRKQNFCHQINESLNNNGYYQCHRVAQYFSDKKNVDIYTSPTLRTIQTSNCIKDVLDTKNVETHIHIDNILYDNDKSVKKILLLKQFINRLYTKHNNQDTTIILITHNHILDLFNKMINGIYSPKTKYHNGSITIVDIVNKINEYRYIENEINISFNNIEHLQKKQTVNYISRY